MEIAKDVFLDTIDKSPKFRAKYIEEQIKCNNVLAEKVCRIFKLNLVHDIYYCGIYKDTFNSKKRKQLKFQEIMFIKKIIIYQDFLSSLIEIRDKVYETDREFTKQFNNNFHSEVDEEFFSQIVLDIQEAYFNDFLN